MNKQQREMEARYASYAVQFPTVARIVSARGLEAAIVVRENDNRFLTLFVDAYRGNFFRAQVSDDLETAKAVGVSNCFGNRVA